MIQGGCHMLPFPSTGKPYGFFPDDYKEKLCCKSSPTGFLHLQASTQHNFFSWSKPSACFTPKAVSVLLRGHFLQLEERQQIPPPPKPQGLTVTARNKAPQDHTSACKNCTYCADPSVFYHSCASLPVTMQAGLYSLTWLQVHIRHSTSHALSFVVLQLLRCASQDLQLLHFNFWPSIGDAELQDQNNKVKSRTRQ